MSARILLLIGLFWPLLTGASEYAADFYYLGVGARAAGQGGAYITGQEGAEACYWNPAVNYQERTLDLEVEQVQLFEGISDYQTLFLRSGIRRGLGISAGILRYGMDDLNRWGALAENRDFTDPEQRADPTPLGQFGARGNSMLLNLSYSHDFVILMGTGILKSVLPTRFTYGVNTRYLSEVIDDVTGSALTTDLGLRLTINGPLVNRIQSPWNITIALSALNLLGNPMVWTTASEHSDPLPTNWRTGISMGMKRRGSLSRFRIALDQEFYDEGVLRVGGELEFMNLLALRFGASGESTSNLNIATGVGLVWRMLRFDYALIQHDLGTTHRFTLGYGFNWTRQ